MQKSSIISGLGLFFSLFLLTACGQNTDGMPGELGQFGEQQQLSTEERLAQQKEFYQAQGLLDATVLDLQIGEKVLVMGTDSSGGMLVADSIMIGIDSLEMTMPENMPQNDEFSVGEGQTMPQAPQGFGAEGQNQFSDDEMAQMRAMRESGEKPTNMGGTGNMRRQSGKPVSGEILSIDENTFTLKLSDGGSKLIAFSDKTLILKKNVAEENN